MQENNCMFLEILQGQKIARDGDLVSATREYILFLKKNLPICVEKTQMEIVKIERGQRGNCHVYIHSTSLLKLEAKSCEGL